MRHLPIALLTVLSLATAAPADEDRRIAPPSADIATSISNRKELGLPGDDTEEPVSRQEEDGVERMSDFDYGKKLCADGYTMIAPEGVCPGR